MRNCAWAAFDNAPPKQAVWARGDVFTLHCPKSLITTQSLKWLDEFNAWKTLGSGDVFALSAKTADAIALLDVEFQRELTREENKE